MFVDTIFFAVNKARIKNTNESDAAVKNIISYESSDG